MIEVKNLFFQHHPSLPYFFKNVSFTLEQGKIHALHGRNGIGKSVLLHILNRTTSPQSITQGLVKTAKNIVLVHQRFDAMLADQFSFLENLQFASMQRFPHPFHALKDIHVSCDILNRFHLDLSTPVYQLSGGQRQILALLMVLQRRIDILLLDEPTATLDEHNSHMVFEFLQTVPSITMVIVCHDQDLMNRYTTGQKICMYKDPMGLRQVQIN